MAGYKTLEVLVSEVDSSGRIPVEVHVEKQQRVRDDESTTRPFIKMRLVVGNRVVFCDIRQAASLAALVDKIVPAAEQELETLLQAQNSSSGTAVYTEEEPTSELRRRRRVRRADDPSRERYRDNGY